MLLVRRDPRLVRRAGAPKRGAHGGAGRHRARVDAAEEAVRLGPPGFDDAARERERRRDGIVGGGAVGVGQRRVTRVGFVGPNDRTPLEGRERGGRDARLRAVPRERREGERGSRVSGVKRRRVRVPRVRSPRVRGSAGERALGRGRRLAERGEARAFERARGEAKRRGASPRERRVEVRARERCGVFRTDGGAAEEVRFEGFGGGVSGVGALPRLGGFPGGFLGGVLGFGLRFARERAGGRGERRGVGDGLRGIAADVVCAAEARRERLERGRGEAPPASARVGRVGVRARRGERVRVGRAADRVEAIVRELEEHEVGLPRRARARHRAHERARERLRRGVARGVRGGRDGGEEAVADGLDERGRRAVRGNVVRRGGEGRRAPSRAGVREDARVRVRVQRRRQRAVRRQGRVAERDAERRAQRPAPRARRERLLEPARGLVHELGALGVVRDPTERGAPSRRLAERRERVPAGRGAHPRTNDPERRTTGPTTGGMQAVVVRTSADEVMMMSRKAQQKLVA